MEYLSQKEYMNLPAETRERVRQEFGIKRTKGNELQNGRLVSDGVTGEELFVKVNEKILQARTGKTGTFQELWPEVVKGLGFKTIPIVMVGTAKDGTTSGTLGVTEVDGMLVADVSTFKKAFCDSCSSKGVKHLKICPKNLKTL